MTEKIKEVQEFFKNKLLAGEFELIDVDDYYVAHVAIRCERKLLSLYVWMNTRPASLSKTGSFMNIEISESEGRTLHDLLKPIMDEHLNAKKEQEELALYNDLKQKFVQFCERGKRESLHPNSRHNSKKVKQ